MPLSTSRPKKLPTAYPQESFRIRKKTVAVQWFGCDVSLTRRCLLPERSEKPEVERTQVLKARAERKVGEVFGRNELKETGRVRAGQMKSSDGNWPGNRKKPQSDKKLARVENQRKASGWIARSDARTASKHLTSFLIPACPQI